MTTYQRPASEHAGNVSLQNRTKYQTDSASQPRVSISSSKIDGDFNYIIDALNDIGKASGSRASIDDRISTILNDDGSLKASVTATLDEWVVDNTATGITRLDDSTFTLNGDVTSVYTPNRRVKLTVGGVELFASVATSSFASNTTTVEMVDIVDASGALKLVSSTPTEVAYSPLTTGAAGNSTVRFEDIQSTGFVVLEDTTAGDKYALRCEAGNLQIVENVSGTWEVRAEVDSSGITIADGAVTFPKLATSAVATQAEAEAGIATDRLMTPKTTVDLMQSNAPNLTPTGSITYEQNTGEIGVLYATRDRPGTARAATVSEVGSGVTLNQDKTFISMYSMYAHPLLPKAWVNFNGTGTVSIQGSYNITSVTDNSTGVFTVNFGQALANTNYATFVQTSEGTAGGDQFTFSDFSDKAASSVKVSTRATNGVFKDVDECNVLIMGETS